MLRKDEGDELGETIRRRAVVVVPAYDEAGTIGEQVRALRGIVHRVIVVDDGSSDETGRLAHDAGATVLTHCVNRGQGAAIQTGIEYCLAHDAEFIVTFDADGQHLPESVPALVEPLISGRAQIALGSRMLQHRREIPWARRWMLKLAVVFTRVLSGARVTDAHNGLRAFTRKAAERIDLQLDRMAHASELIDQVHRSGMAYVEVPVRIRYTSYSLSKGQSNAAALRILWDYFVGKLLP